MSSLSLQLKAISLKTASVALDRKSRSKIHSKSLIYDPKTAAAQDYDYIYLVCLEGFEDLCALDNRFYKFKLTLFSETSINLDRNVQLADVIDVLNKNIHAFLALIGPYYLLTPAIKAVEWLVRRFHANIHNAEDLLLTLLPFYSHPIFVKMMNVVPKQNVPKIFEWCVGYKDLLKSPTLASLIKTFSDPAFFKYYSMYLVEQLEHGVAFKEQLVLFLANSVQVIASRSRDPALLSDVFLPVVLEVISELLKARNDTQYSVGVQHDAKLTAYSIISVLKSVVPMSPELIVGLTQTILSDKLTIQPNLKRQTVIVLGQLWAHIDINAIMATTPFKSLPVQVLLQDNLAAQLKDDGYKISTLIEAYFLTTKSFEVFPLVDVNSSKDTYERIVRAVLEASSERDILEASRPQLVSIFEQLLKLDGDVFSSTLDNFKKGFRISDLEMMLMCTLGEHGDNEADIEDKESDDAEEIEEPIEEDSLTVLQSLQKDQTPTFLTSSTLSFQQLTLALIRLLSPAASSPAAQRQLLAKFSKTVFVSPEASISFFLRVAVTAAVPYSVRLLSLRFIKRRLRELTGQNVDFYLLTPLLVLGLYEKEKYIRAAFVELIKVVHANSVRLASVKGKHGLFMEDTIYASTEASNRSIIAPADGLKLLELLTKDSPLENVVVDRAQLAPFVGETLFKAQKPGQKKFGQLLVKTFLFNQWAGLKLPISFKSLAWELSSKLNESTAFESDISSYFASRQSLIESAKEAKLDFDNVIEPSIVALVGSSNVEWLLTGLGNSEAANLQTLCNEQLLEVFTNFKTDSKLRLTTKLIDLLISDETPAVDPMDTLQSLTFDHDLMLSVLKNVQISTSIPEQGVPKRRRRSSLSTRSAMARDDINNMASVLLKKLTIVLDLLETNLKRDEGVQIAQPDLLQSLFKSLTDLDYLGNDGNLPVLYAQETLASCMLRAIIQMKNGGNHTLFDSNSIRADLIVNSIRSSQSPQVQNRLLLVIAELASLAPEIILHSVMPIFTFMGAHTIRQDDEFSNSVLQQTISKVIPAIAANGSTSMSNEIEFLLTSFAAAFQHIPRHRRVKLFTTLTKTLGHDNSLHIILFLMAQQYASNAAKLKLHECRAVVEFATAVLKQFEADEQLQAVQQFYGLWSLIPDQPLESGSDQFNDLSGRSIFGAAILALPKSGLLTLKADLLQFIDVVLGNQQDRDQPQLADSLSNLKMKIALVLLEKNNGDSHAMVLQPFREAVSFVLSSLEAYTSSKDEVEVILSNLYKLLTDLLDLLPLNFFIESIIEPINDSKSLSPLLIKIARNLCILAGRKIETELNSNNIDEDVTIAVLNHLLPVLVENIDKNSDIALQQALLDTFASIVNKFGTASTQLTIPANAKLVVDALKTVTSEHCLLNNSTEVIISSINVITSIVNILGVKVIGFFPKIVPPVLKIWESTVVQEEDDDVSNDAAQLLQTAILVLFSCFVKKMPAFMTTNLEAVLLTILTSDLVDNTIRSNLLHVIVEHMDRSQVLKSLCNVWWNKKFYTNDNVGNLGLFLNTMQLTVEQIEKKTAASQATLFIKWLVQAFEFRDYIEHDADDKFDNNTVRRLESSFHTVAITYAMKLNDKTFRPLFASLVRWAVSGEGAAASSTEQSRLLAFFKFFNKLQEQLKSIITLYFTYLIDPVAGLLQKFSEGKLDNINLRRVILNSLTTSFKYDQDDYWSQQLRFETICEPLLQQLYNIEDSIGKYVVKAIASFTVNVSLDEYNEKLVHGMIQYISNENDRVSSQSKIWGIRVLKAIFQKMGEQWLSYLPTLIPYIAELLEDDDEAVELEVRKGLVRVIENVLGEPLDRYLD